MKKILIVDDDYLMRTCIKAVLKNAGFRTSEVPDGISAIGELLIDRPRSYLIMICL